MVLLLLVENRSVVDQVADLHVHCIIVPQIVFLILFPCDLVAILLCKVLLDVLDPLLVYIVAEW